MVGIVTNVGRLIDTVREGYTSEVMYLRAALEDRNQRIKELENIIFQRFGITPVTTQPSPEGEAGQGPVGLVRARNRREQMALYESKFKVQPPELAQREVDWRREAEKAAQELEDENAGKVKEAI